MVDISIVNGVYKPTYTVTGGHHPYGLLSMEHGSTQTCFAIDP
jgi:hypothetical protein